MTDITSPDHITRVSVIESARIRASMCADRGLIELAMVYHSIYTCGSAVYPIYLDDKKEARQENPPGKQLKEEL